MFGSAREARIELTAPNRKLRRDLKRAEKNLGRFGKDAGGRVKAGFQAAMGGMAAFGTMAGLADVGRGAFEFEKTLTRIGIQADLSGDKLQGFRDTAAHLRDTLGVSRETSIRAATALVNLQGAAGASADKMAILSKAGLATGAPLEGLAGVSYALENAFGRANEGAFNLEGALSAVIEAGKQGSVPLGEMSTVLQQVAMRFSEVSNQGKRGAAELAAVIQVARAGFGSAGEVSTGIRAFLKQLVQKSTQLRKVGIEVYNVGKNGEKTLKPLREILAKIDQTGLVKDPDKLGGIFKSSEARQFLEVLVAQKDKFEEFTAAAARSNSVQTDSQRYLMSTAGRMQKVMARMRGEVEKLFTPERLEKFTDAAELAAKAVGLIIDHIEILVALAGGAKLAKGAHAMAAFAKASMGVGRAGDGIDRTADGLARMTRLKSGLLGIGAALGSITQAGAAGYALGTAIDQALGLSDKISNALSGLHKRGASQDPIASKLDPTGRGHSLRSEAAANRRALAKSEELDRAKAALAAIQNGSVGDRFRLTRSPLFGNMVTAEQAARDRVAKARDAFADTERYVPARERGGVMSFLQEKEHEANAINMVNRLRAETEGKLREAKEQGATNLEEIRRAGQEEFVEKVTAQLRGMGPMSGDELERIGRTIAREMNRQGDIVVQVDGREISRVVRNHPDQLRRPAY